jgi:hypothetical protein
MARHISAAGRARARYSSWCCSEFEAQVQAKYDAKIEGRKEGLNGAPAFAQRPVGLISPHIVHKTKRGQNPEVLPGGSRTRLGRFQAAKRKRTGSE